MKQLLLIFFFICSSIQLYCQQNRKPSIKKNTRPIVRAAKDPVEIDYVFAYNFSNYSVEDGLGQRDAWTVFVDSRQIVWIGTYGGGLNKFDGKKITSLSKKDGLQDNIIWEILEDEDGNLWMATDGGLIMYDGKNFTLKLAENRLNGQSVVRAICHGPGKTIWLGTAHTGIYLYDYINDIIIDHVGSEDLIQMESIHVWSVEMDRDENLWISLNRNGLAKYDGDRIINYRADSCNLAHDLILDVFCDSRGRIWAATGKGASMFNGEDFESYTSEDGLIGNWIHHIFESSSGEMYFCTHNSGITVYNDSKGFYKNITRKEGLGGLAVTYAAEDANKNIWFAHYGGVSKFEGEAFMHFYPNKADLDIRVHDILEDGRNTYWFATNMGLLKLENQKLLQYTKNQGLSSDTVNCITKDLDGNLWVGTINGLNKFDGKNWTIYYRDLKSGIPHSYIVDLEIDKEGTIWGGTNWNTFSIKDDEIAWYTESTGQAYYLIKEILCDSRGNRWIGTYGGGVSLNLVEKTRADTNQFINLNTERDILETNYTPVISEDREGNIWISNFGEKILIIKSDWRNIKDTSDWFVELDHENGLINANVEYMIEDQHGDMWIGTVNGVDRISKASKAVETGNYEFTHYGVFDGLKAIQCNTRAGILDTKGNLWFSAGNLVTRHNPDLLNKQQPVPKTRITDIKLHFESVQWDSLDGVTFKSYSKWDFLPNGLSLPFDQNHLTFEFIGVTHHMPQNVKYQWKLEGFDDEWSPMATERKVTYAGLPPGSYTFKIRSIGTNTDGNFGTAQFSFEIRPPFWQTWWFRTATFAAFLLIVWIIFQWRTKSLRKRQVVLENTVQERTKEVHEQKELLEEQHQEIMDSINYAQRIQDAILPPSEVVAKIIPDHFIYYRPKDIVAGDFYWFESQEDLTLLAAADCTGHGVPGAMVSVVCHNALNRAVREFELKEPHLILNKTRELVIETLAQHGKEVKDGMDISLCRFMGDKLQYAGANNPLWIIRNGELLETKADKQPIGLYEGMKDFTLHEIELQKGDEIYMFTDGYADQFGGEKGKKLKYKPFKEILKELSETPLSDRSTELDKLFVKWMGRYEQVDDVCVIGVRV